MKKNPYIENGQNGHLKKHTRTEFHGQNGFVILFHQNIMSYEINQMLGIGKARDAFVNQFHPLQNSHPNSWRSSG
jgi:hypothetical protein